MRLKNSCLCLSAAARSHIYYASHFTIVYVNKNQNNSKRIFYEIDKEMKTYMMQHQNWKWSTSDTSLLEKSEISVIWNVFFQFLLSSSDSSWFSWSNISHLHISSPQFTNSRSSTDHLRLYHLRWFDLVSSIIFDSPSIHHPIHDRLQHRTAYQSPLQTFNHCKLKLPFPSPQPWHIFYNYRYDHYIITPSQ